MAHGLSSVFETGTNELSRDEYMAMLADGTAVRYFGDGRRQPEESTDSDRRAGRGRPGDGRGRAGCGRVLEDEESLCWKHLTVKGCADGSCPFIHMDRQGMGWCPSEQQVCLLRSRVQRLKGDKKWDFGKISSFELDAGIFE